VDYRPLGRTGVSVSQLCLGAMVLGAFGASTVAASQIVEVQWTAERRGRERVRFRRR